MPKFDPFTGEPIVEEAANEVKPSTEETAGAETAAAPASDDFNNFGGASANVSTEPVTSKKFPVKLVALGAAAVAAIAVIVVLVMMLVSSPEEKIIAAFENTFNEVELISVVDTKAFSKGKFTSSFDGEIEGVKMSGSFIVDGKDKEISVTLDGEPFDDLSATVQIVKDQLKLSVSELDDVYTINYSDPGDGDLIDLIGEDNFEIVCDALSTIYDAEASGSSSLENKLLKEFKAFRKTIEYEKLDAKSFKVDGEKSECGGYAVKISGKDVAEFIGNCIDIIESEEPDTFEQLEKMDVLDEIEDAIEEIEDVKIPKIKIYISKKKLAAIIIEDVEIDFKGKDFRLADVVIKEGDNEVATLTGKKDGKEEKFTFKSGNSSFGYEYDAKSGEYTIETVVNDYWYGSKTTKISGTLTKEGKGFEMTIDKVKVNDEKTDVGFTVTMVPSASLSKLDGDEVALDELDEDELNDLVEDAMGAFGDMGSLF